MAVFSAKVWLRLPAYLRIIFAVLAGNIALVMAWTALVRTPTLRQDPFSSYEYIFLGRLKSDLVVEEYSCQAGPIPRLMEYCSYAPTAGTFSHIGVMVEGSRIILVTFTLRENTLRIGDLALWWGKPDVQLMGRVVTLSWPGRGVTTLTIPSHSRRFDYFSPVLHIALAQGESMAYLPLPS